MVMKVMNVGVKGTDEFKRKYKAVEAEIEVGIRLGLCCDFLVRVMEVFRDGPCCCLISEYCSGGDLQQKLNKKKQMSEFVFFVDFFFFLLIHI
jgi:hypothetical protein